MAAFELRGHACSAERRVIRWACGSHALHPVLRALGGAGEVILHRAGFDLRERLEIRGGHIVRLQRKTKLRETIQRSRKVIDRVVGNWKRTVAALVVHFEAEVEDPFFADLNVIRDFLPARRLAVAAFIERKFRVNQFAVILDEPLDAVVRPATLFIGGERDNDVAIRLEAFLLVEDQIREPNRGLRLVVAGPAAVEISVLLDELEGVHAPVGAQGLDDVGVREQQDRLKLAGTVVADHEVRLLGARPANKNIGIRKARRAQSSCCCLRDGGRRPSGEPGLNFDEFLVDFARQRPLRFRPRGLWNCSGMQ